MKLSTRRAGLYGAAVVVLGLIAALAAGASAIAARAAAVPVAPTPWRVVYQNRAGQPSLRDIVALSGNDIWALGDRRSGPFVAHWAGRRWVTAAVPHPAGFNPQQIQAPSPTDVWVLGYEPHGRAGAVHWNGRTWRTVGFPADAGPFGVVFSPFDIWLTSGFSVCANPGGCQSTVLHWDGRAWARFSVPILLTGIRGTSDSDLWLTGLTSINSGGSQLVGRLGAFRWNGRSWRPVAIGRVQVAGGASLTVASPSNMWIGATRAKRARNGERPTLGVHWNGTRWTVLTAPDSLGDASVIAIDGRGGAWFGPDLRWNGREWIEVVGRWLPSWANPFSAVAIAHIPGTAVDVVAVDSPGGTVIGASGPLGWPPRRGRQGSTAHLNGSPPRSPADR